MHPSDSVHGTSSASRLMLTEVGRVVAIAPGVQRLLAPNPSPLTGPGTNTYLLGDPPRAVLDPGPNDAAHVAAILAAVPKLEHIFVTHSHSDHSPAAAALRTITGAPVIGRPAPRDGRQDLTYAPDVVPTRDERYAIEVETGPTTLRAIDTPGHASNHVCYLLESSGVLFSGDHVLDGVTPVILSPDGHMGAYLEALHRLLTYPVKSIAPGHGRLLENPQAVIEGVIAHRLRREAKVMNALLVAGTASLDDLLPVVYDDVKPELHALARLSLEAHLIKLVEDGRVARDGATWRAV